MRPKLFGQALLRPSALEGFTFCKVADRRILLMKGKKLAVWLGGGLGAFLFGLLLGVEGGKTFNPPRTGVVEISKVFELYEKKKDRQEQLQGETKVLEDKLKDLEKRYKDLLQELPNLEEGGAKKNEKTLEKVRLEIEVKSLKDRELKRLRETQFKYLEEIRDEISQEIKVYQKAQDLDLVLEQTVTAESDEAGRGFRWPIVHYAKPEIDITNEIVERLNTRYRSTPRTPPATSPQAPSKESGEKR